MMITRRDFFGGLAGAAMAAGSGAPAAAPLVAAAADLRFVLATIARLFTAANGQQLSLTFGSSSNLTRRDGAVYAVGKLALIVNRQSTWDCDANLKGVTQAVADNRLTRFTIANPEHAPYGQRAREVLEGAGLWGKLQGRLVLGENVAQAAQYVASAAAEGALVAYTLAKSDELQPLIRSALIPEDRYTALRQRMVLLKNAGPVARAFFHFLLGDTARQMLRDSGFGVPNG
jgi:molybdate transport system substrate-binding protein